MNIFLSTVVGLFVFAVSPLSFAKNLSYYTVHPTALQKAMARCASKSEADAHCAQLRPIAIRLNDLAYALRTNPLEYGQQILALQTTIAKQSKAAKPPISLANNQQALRERLAIIKWLESPGSA